MIHRFRREGLALLSGLLLAGSFPKYGRGSLAFVALVPLLVALVGVRPAHGLRLGYLAGAAAAVGTLYWTEAVVVHYGGLPLPVGITVMLLLCLAVAIFPALFGWLVSRWLIRHGPRALLAAPLAWVATEVLRVRTFFRFPWCLLGYSLHDHPALIQIASATAVYGVSFLLVGVAASVAYLLVEPSPVARRRVGLATAGLLGAVFTYGAWALARPLPERGSLRVGLVQASVLQEDKWDPGQAWENLERHLILTQRAVAAGAQLVVWPESSLPFYYDRNPAVAQRLQDLARRGNVYILFGNDDREAGTGDQYRVWVGAKLLSPDGRITLRYHKIRLVPFGEYVPLQPLLTLGGRVTAKLVQEVADFTPGREAVVGEVRGHRLGVFICYEAIFPELIRQFVAHRAELLVNITNDGWYGRSSAPFQHFAMARFRAVENGRYLVRAANTGISGVIDPRGRVVVRTRLFDRTATVADVPLVAGTTFYARHGDVFAWACFLSALLLTLEPVPWRRLLPRRGRRVG